MITDKALEAYKDSLPKLSNKQLVQEIASQTELGVNASQLICAALCGEAYNRGARLGDRIIAEGQRIGFERRKDRQINERREQMDHEMR